MFIYCHRLRLFMGKIIRGEDGEIEWVYTSEEYNALMTEKNNQKWDALTAQRERMNKAHIDTINRMSDRHADLLSWTNKVMLWVGLGCLVLGGLLGADIAINGIEW